MNAAYAPTTQAQKIAPPARKQAPKIYFRRPSSEYKFGDMRHHATLIVELFKVDATWAYRRVRIQRGFYRKGERQYGFKDRMVTPSSLKRINKLFDVPMVDEAVM